MGSQIENGANGGSSLIFLGTGCSSAVPNARCLIQPSDPPCKVCSDSLSIPPELNPNYRCNTSLLIDYLEDDGVSRCYILIDVGKCFREQVLRWFVRHKIPRVDSIILTHEHADAVLGLDDIRVVQPFSPTNDIEPTPIYLTQFAMDSISVKFPYLATKKLKDKRSDELLSLTGELLKATMKNHFFVLGSSLFPCQYHFWALDQNSSFYKLGHFCIAFCVMHGEDYVCLGFLFGRKSRVAYISDVSRFIPSTESVISKSGNQQLDLLILDTLYRGGSHNTHLCWDQSLDAVKRICPKKALLIGMTHEYDHDRDNEILSEWSRREGIPVQLAHDGLRLCIDL
ncbi:Metallo-hydrolase/oxidoreductase superfamily protein [Rhynchospora pubera]|uniref:Metallo-hydrolase/oxidoreductase superfamily protein n=1 Tax=Rhynchospora pubera TaxID=906938 RepID=A0AAV8DLB9_9POAL|nr:Metallo-hydrolase/oxidoreductase superfamily protein [Rhynchospora pubera]